MSDPVEDLLHEIVDACSGYTISFTGMACNACGKNVHRDQPMGLRGCVSAAIQHSTRECVVAWLT